VQRDITFVLIVDDFGVKYKHLDDLTHLENALRKYYDIKTDKETSTFLGTKIKHDRIARTLTLEDTTSNFDIIKTYRPEWIDKPRGAHSPSIYIPPKMGSREVQAPITDTSPKLSPEKAKECQRIIGAILYKARIVQPSALEACNRIQAELHAPTERTLEKIDRLLAYLASYPNPKLVFHASDMILHAQSDASDNSLPGSKAMLGGIFFFGMKNNPDMINGPVHTLCMKAPMVTTGAGDSETAGAFFNSQMAIRIRNAARDMGYPQPTTAIGLDNTATLGYADGTHKASKSKHWDRKYNWIKEKVKEKELTFFHLRGNVNLADFFTKPISVEKHLAMIPFIETHEIQPNNPFHSKTIRRKTEHMVRKIAQNTSSTAPSTTLAKPHGKTGRPSKATARRN
jgi:hypothetical protein